MAAAVGAPDDLLRNDSSITRRWLEKIVSRYIKQTVTVLHFVNREVEKESDLKRTEVRFVSVDYVDGDNTAVKRAHFVLKFLGNPDNRGAFVEPQLFARRETNFYDLCKDNTQVKSIMQKEQYIPPIILCGYDGKNLTIMMEDVTKLGYVIKVAPDGSTFANTVSSLKSIAAVHAAGFTYLYSEPLASFPLPFLDEEAPTKEEFISCLETFESLVNDPKYRYIFKKLYQCAGKIVSFAKTNTCEITRTIVHGRFWAGNVLLHEKLQEPACLIDWQHASQGDPCTDLVTFFSISVDISILHYELDSLVKEYYDTLLKYTEGLFPATLNDFKAGVKNLWPHGLYVLVTSLPKLLAERAVSTKRLVKYIDFLKDLEVFHAL